MTCVLANPRDSEMLILYSLKWEYAAKQHEIPQINQQIKTSGVIS